MNMKTTKTFYENGNIETLSEINDEGQRHGVTKLYHQNGQLQTQVSFTNGSQNDGEVISYHDNGNISRIITLKNELKQGKFIEYSKIGKDISREGIYLDGEIISISDWNVQGLVHDETGEIDIGQGLKTLSPKQRKERLMNETEEMIKKLQKQGKHKLLDELKEVYKKYKQEYDKLDGRYVEVPKQDLGKIIQEVSIDIDTLIDECRENLSNPYYYDEENYNSFEEINCTLYKNKKEVNKGILFQHIYHFWSDVEEKHDDIELRNSVMIVDGKVFEDFEDYKYDNDVKIIYRCGDEYSDEPEPEDFFNEYVKRLTN
jgi:hypothetical protein